MFYRGIHSSEHLNDPLNSTSRRILTSDPSCLHTILQILTSDPNCFCFLPPICTLLPPTQVKHLTRTVTTMLGFHVFRKLLPSTSHAIFPVNSFGSQPVRFSATCFTSCRKFSSDNMNRPQVFFDMAADKTPLGRIIMEVNLF